MTKPEETMAVSLNFTLSEVVSRLMAVLNARVEAKLESDFDEWLKNAIGKTVEARLRTLTDAALKEAFNKTLTEGWQRTNTYGEPTGPKLTLQSRVLEYLTKGDGYRDPVADVYKEAVQAELKGEAGKLLTEAKVRLRGFIDSTIADKMREVVAQAVKS